LKSLKRLAKYLSKGVFAKQTGAVHEAWLELLNYVSSIGRSHKTLHVWQVGGVEHALAKPSSNWRDLEIHVETVRLACEVDTRSDEVDAKGRRKIDELVSDSVEVVHKVLKWLIEGVEALEVYKATHAVPVDMGE
jgi:hypothetical protein